MTLQEFLQYMQQNHTGVNPLPRNMMNKVEIKLAEKLVKDGKVMKGTAIEDGRVRIYYCESK